MRFLLFFIISFFLLVDANFFFPNPTIKFLFFF